MRDTYIDQGLCISLVEMLKTELWTIQSTLFGVVAFKFVAEIIIHDFLLYGCKVIHLINKGMISPYVQE